MTAPGQRIDVLDHGHVRLVDHMGGDLAIVRAARCSHDAAWRAGADAGSDARLIRYLVRHRHNTPVEAVELQFEVMAPIFVLRQWMRHRTWSFSEVSGRYSVLPAVFYVPDADKVGVQSASNRQARDLAGGRPWKAGAARLLMRASGTLSFLVYRALLRLGVPRELARTVLPLSTYSRMFAKVDLHNLLSFLAERLPSDAQYEIRVYAEAVLEMARGVAPVTIAAWEETRGAS